MGFLSRCLSGMMPHLKLEENILVLLELQQGYSRVPTGTSGTRSWGLREVLSPLESRGVPRDPSAVTAGAEVLIWR